MLILEARPHDTVQVSQAEFGILPEDSPGLPWVAERVASVRQTRVGLEIVIGPFVGQLVVPDRLILNVAEPFPGTLRACLSVTTGGRRAGSQDTAAGTVAVQPWDPVITTFAGELATYVRGGAEKRYLQHRLTTSRPRGRVDIPRTATKVWSRGRTDLLACDTRVLSEDTHLNRALLAAAVKAEALALQLGVRSPLRDLRTASMALSGAQLESAPSVRAARAEINPLLSGMASLLGLAEVILDGIPALPPPRLEDTPYPVSGWLNTEKIFEEAVRFIVADAAPAGAVRPGEGDGVTLLSAIPGGVTPDLSDADPDVVVETGGRCLLLDAKYRRHGDGYSQGELYQLMAHARAYRAHAAALVAPAVRRAPGAYAIGMDSAGTTYYVVAVDPSSDVSLRQQISAWVRQRLEEEVPATL